MIKTLETEKENILASNVNTSIKDSSEKIGIDRHFSLYVVFDTHHHLAPLHQHES